MIVARSRAPIASARVGAGRVIGGNKGQLSGLERRAISVGITIVATVVVINLGSVDVIIATAVRVMAGITGICTVTSALRRQMRG